MRSNCVDRNEMKANGLGNELKRHGADRSSMASERRQAVAITYSVKLLIVCLFGEQMYGILSKCGAMIETDATAARRNHANNIKNLFSNFRSPKSCAQFSFIRLEFIIYTFFYL